MLLNLTITNFAIIDRLEVAFDGGFNVLTGETGAGKSIILDAVGLLLGDRARPELVRSGAEEATVAALFDLGGRDDLRQMFTEAGFSVDDELVLRRVVQASGRSRAYVNGALVTLGQLQPLAERLVAVCGQHEHQGLLQRSVHQAILDQYGGLLDQLSAYRRSFEALQRVVRQLESLEEAERDRARRIDELRFQSEEIAAAKLVPDEEESLQADRLLLQNAERLEGLARQGYEALYGGHGAVCEVLGGLADEMQAASRIDVSLGGHAETLRRSLFDLEDVAIQLRSYLDRIGHEPDRLEQIEARLALLARLKRKYSGTLTEILVRQEACDLELSALENVGETREALARERAGLEDQTRQLGAVLSKARRRVADDLTGAVSTELVDLAMPGAAFAVAFHPLPQPGADGLERSEFLVSPNPGEPLMPIARVASGGELSRLMLALKRLAPDADGVPTIIFDEVDAGIGGAAATAVGRKLQAVSCAAQVLCVTHLPQVAAFASHHHRVIKREVNGRTLTSMERLEGDARVEEMARMLGGSQITERTLLHARELIETSVTARF